MCTTATVLNTMARGEKKKNPFSHFIRFILNIQIVRVLPLLLFCISRGNTGGDFVASETQFLFVPKISRVMRAFGNKGDRGGNFADSGCVYAVQWS